MQIFKKEKKVVQLVLAHAEKTEECVRATIESVNVFIEGDHSESQSTAGGPNELESEADALLREIRDLLYSGAYLPLIRGDIYSLMTSVDEVANKAEACYDFFRYQQPAIPAEYRSTFREILDLTGQSCAELEKALRNYFDPKGDLDAVKEHNLEVGKLESMVDKTERMLTAEIFSSTLEKGEKLHVAKALSKVASLSDHIENASDALALASLKSVV